MNCLSIALCFIVLLQLVSAETYPTSCSIDLATYVPVAGTNQTTCCEMGASYGYISGFMVLLLVIYLVRMFLIYY
jgi:hypothetical protein